MFKHPAGATFFLLLLLAVSVCASSTTPAARHHKKHQAPAKPEPVAPSPAQQPPAALEQITLQQMPASPAQVLYANRQLTITAENSTMSDILRQVKKLTGATMDFPQNASERVVGQFGPGPAREVLASLLDGTNFNYVLLGSLTNPSGVDRVIVTVKPSGPENINPAPQNHAQDASEQEGLGTSDSDQQDQSDSPPEEQQQPPSSDDDQNSSQGAIKTPQQLLQELQRQQQMQQHSTPQQQAYPSTQDQR
jgi:hypothetical protein